MAVWTSEDSGSRMSQAQHNPYTNLSSEVHTAMTDLQAQDLQYEPQHAHELFKLENCVQIFFVSASGHVSTFSAPETLRILKLEPRSEQGETAAHFLQVGGWTQPLVAGARPCLQAENGAIMFPDIYSDTPDSSVGLVLLDSVEPQLRQQLMTHLQQLTALQTAPQLPQDQQLGTLGTTIVKGCEKLAQGIEIGAEKAGTLIEYVTERGQEKLSKAEEDAKVGSLTRGSVNVAKSASTATVKVSGFVANRVGKLTKSLASYLANKATPNTSVGGRGKKAGAMAYLVDAARGGLIGYGTVYNGLESSAKVLGNNVKENSVKIVNR